MILPYWLIDRHVFPTYFVPLYLALVFEIWASSLIVLKDFRRRKLWGLWIALGALTMIGAAIGLGYLRNLAPDSLLLRMACHFLLYILVLGTVFLSFEEKPIDILLIWVSIMAIRESADGVDTLLKLFLNTPSMSFGYIASAHFVINGLLFDLIHLAVQIPLGFVFARYKGSSRDREIVVKTVLLSFTLMLVTVVIKAIVVSHSEESKVLYGAAVALTLLLSLFTLLLRSDALIGSQKNREIMTMNAVLSTQQKQFEDSKQSIALINAKVHDIKHRIDDFGDQVASDTLDRLKSSVEIYDRSFHTGSQVLDTILYSKSLECDANQIRLTAIGDGTPLHFIPSSKRFYLFSNIIDNAIEATREVKDPEKRIIGIALQKKGEEFLIEEYNYFEGARNFQGEELPTTKQDKKTKHGLGIKSIRMFAEEYGGKLELKIHGNMFFLALQIPLHNTQREKKTAQ